MGPSVNTQYAEFAPGISPDGKYLFFTSERPGIVAATPEGRPPGDIYQVELSSIEGINWPH
jgi:Tol biopolymer transport system component